MNNDELYHFGIKGMRWGRRKAKQQTIDTPSESKPKTILGKKTMIGTAAAGVGAAAIGAGLLGVKLGPKKGSKLVVGSVLTTATLGMIGGYKLGKLREKRRSEKEKKATISAMQTMYVPERQFESVG